MRSRRELYVVGGTEVNPRLAANEQARIERDSLEKLDAAHLAAIAALQKGGTICNDRERIDEAVRRLETTHSINLSEKLTALAARSRYYSVWQEPDNIAALYVVAQRLGKTEELLQHLSTTSNESH